VGATHCAGCGREGSASDAGHEACTRRLDLEPPRFCTRCGGRLDVQVYPTGYRATCRRCDHVHPARDVIAPTHPTPPSGDT
jgi:hypothetical protein